MSGSRRTVPTISRRSSRASRVLAAAQGWLAPQTALADDAVIAALISA